MPAPREGPDETWPGREVAIAQHLVTLIRACYICRHMRLSLVIAILLAMAAGGAESPPEQNTAWVPDARLFYESDTRAYYRPCG
jgi:hypothetical protein